MEPAAPDDLDYLFDDEDPHALIEAQRRQDEDSDSDDDGDSDSTDELRRAIEEAGGFGSGSGDDKEEGEADDGHGFIETQDQQVALDSADLELPKSSPKSPSPSVPIPTKLTVDIFQEPPEADNDESEQRFEAVPETKSVDLPAKPVRERRPKKTPRTLNLNGLPIRLDENGVEIGYKETPPAENTYAWVSDTPIVEDDPHFAKGCQRRMVFVSDPVPVDRQYRVAQSQTKKTGEVEFLSAVDKAYDWNRTRRGVIGATDETLRDGKIPRHFVLKMGSPNGPNGDALRVAERLKALVEHFFVARLAKSHMTIEVAIPFHRLGAQSYYEKYMDKIRAVMEMKSIRDRLTVHLDPFSAQQYLNCDSKQFHPPNTDHDAVWINKTRDFELIWTFVNQNRIASMPRDWIPSGAEVAVAKQQWLRSQKLNEADKKNHVDQAIKKVQDFVRFVHHYETWKRDGSMPPAPGAAPTAVPVQQQRVSALGPSIPPSAPAPYSFFAPPQLNTFTSTFYSAPQPSELFRQPGPVPSLPYGSPYDQYSSGTPFGAESVQQARAVGQATAQQTREYRHRIQQANAQAWEQLRQQAQASPAAPRSVPSAPAAPLSPSGLIVRSNVMGLRSPATPSLGKCVGNEK